MKNLKTKIKACTTVVQNHTYNDISTDHVFVVSDVKDKLHESFTRLLESTDELGKSQVRDWADAQLLETRDYLITEWLPSKVERVLAAFNKEVEAAVSTFLSSKKALHKALKPLLQQTQRAENLYTELQDKLAAIISDKLLDVAPEVYARVVERVCSWRLAGRSAAERDTKALEITSMFTEKLFPERPTRSNPGVLARSSDEVTKAVQTRTQEGLSVVMEALGFPADVKKDIAKQQDVVNKLKKQLTRSRLYTCKHLFAYGSRKPGAHGKRLSAPKVRGEDRRQLCVEPLESPAPEDAQAMTLTIDRITPFSGVGVETGCDADPDADPDADVDADAVLTVHAKAHKKTLARIKAFAGEHKKQEQEETGNKPNYKVAMDPIVTLAVPFDQEELTRFLHLVAREPSQAEGMHYLVFVVVLEKDADAARRITRHADHAVLVVVKEDVLPSAQDDDDAANPPYEFLVDLAKLLGKWLLDKHGLPRYVRALVALSDVKEATNLLCSQPCTFARFMQGLTFFMKDALRRERNELLARFSLKEIGRRVPHDMLLELVALVHDIKDQNEQNERILSFLKNCSNPSEEVQALLDLDRERVSSISAVPTRHQRVNWYSTSGSVKPRYTVREYAKRGKTFEQTTVVLNNTQSQDNAFASKRKEFLHPRFGSESTKYNTAEGKLAVACMRRDLCCLVTDEFTCHYKSKGGCSFATQQG